MRKQIETTLDPTLDPGMAVAEIQLPHQSRPFVISGISESVIQAAKRAPAVHMPVEQEKPATRPVRAPHDTLRGRVGQNITAYLFDKKEGTNLYEQLQEKRRNERIVKAGVELGLISLTDTVCQRHAHAVDQLKG